MKWGTASALVILVSDPGWGMVAIDYDVCGRRVSVCLFILIHLRSGIEERALPGPAPNAFLRLTTELRGTRTLPLC